MTSRGKRIVVFGIAGRSPFAGVAWQLLHYLEALVRLGHEVTYVEDTGDWPYDADRDEVSGDPGYTLRYIAGLAGRCGLGERWAYRAASAGDRVFGLSEARLQTVLESADALLNITGSTRLRGAALRVPVRIYVESDPGLPQIEVAQDKAFTLEVLESHTHRFTFGESYGMPGCELPVGRFEYLPTRQPVVIDWWDAAPEAPSGAPSPGRFTTVSSWHQTGKDIEWNGRLYAWSKHEQFLEYVDLPRRTAVPLELALASSDPAVGSMLRGYGWSVRDAVGLTKKPDPYRDYVQQSRAEFTVAKQQYTALRTGWFSDRSACYLAAGRPVVTQQTGFTEHLPSGRGLFAFESMDDVLAAFDAIESDYEGQREAAREIAREYFDAEKVVASMLERAGV